MTMQRPCLLILLLAALLAQLHVPLVGAKKKHKAVVIDEGCENVTVEDRVPQLKGKNWTDGEDGWRYVAANHKTGTFLGKCLCKKVFVPRGVPCKRPKGSTGHTKGDGFDPHNLALNMVRNPFVMIHSGYEYHKGLNINHTHESWAFMKIYDSKAKKVGTGVAVDTYNKWCKPNKTEITVTDTTTYHELLNTLPVDDGLVLETFRAMHRDIPYMLTAMRRCSEVEAVGQAGEGGGCHSVDLEEVMTDYTDVFYSQIAPALGVEGRKDLDDFADRFAETCDPFAETAKKGDAEHRTEHGKVREAAIEWLRKLDLQHFHGAVHAAEENYLTRLNASKEELIEIDGE